MYKPTWNLSAVVFALMVFVSGQATADDSLPPCWRGGSNTTYQSWIFTVSNNPAAPELFTNPNGPPAATFTIGTFGKGWLAASFGGRTGLWELGRAGQVSLVVSNFGAIASASKYVQVQVTYFEDSLAYRPPAVSIAGATLVSSQTINNLSAPPGVWKTQVTVWQIFPSPSGETISIAGDPAKGLLIDQIIVDTRVAVGGDGDVPAFRPCWRGSTGSTFQHWAFGMSNNPAALPAELVTNSFGAPVASLALGAFSSGFVPEVSSFFGCRQGVWDLGRLGTMTLSVPNDPSGTPGSYKYVQVAVTQLRDGIYAQTAAVVLSGGTLVNQQEQIVETNSFGEIWFVHKTLWRMGPPCPPSETVVITGGTNGSLIDQVVIDTLCLSLPCPSDILASADLGLCSKSNVTWSVPAIDGCVLTNVICVPPLGSTFPVGTNVVTCVAYDRYGGTRTCNFFVTIKDDQPPTIVCPANLIVARNPAQCGAFVNFIPLALDNCSVASVTATPTNGSLFPLGLTTVAAVAHDASGNNSMPCSFTVQVIDFTGDLAAFQPCWRGRVGSTFQQWAFGVSNNPAVIAPELATNSFGVAQVAISVGAFSSGYLDQYSFLGCRQGIWDLGRSGSLTVNVPNAPAAPVGSYKYVQVAVTQYRDSIYAQNAAIAIAGGILVGQQEQNIETNQLGGIWTVEKSVWRLGPPCPANETIVLTGGTNGTLIDQVVVDTLCVDFPCATDLVASADLGQCSKSNVTWSVPVVDGCVVTNVTCVPAVGSTFPVGTNSVTCVVYDGFGGTKTCNFTVIVNDTQPPIAACQNISVNLDAFGAASIIAADVDNGSSDNCGIASRIVTPDSFNCANVGPNNVTLTVTDVHGNFATCGAIVTVVDDQLPSFTCPAGITNNADAGLCSATFALPALVATDNCGVASVTSNAPASFIVGTTPVIWTVVDVHDNTNSCVQLVTILDNQMPQFACPVGITNNADPGLCNATMFLPPLVATDNCGVALVTSNAPASFIVGTTPVIWTVVDVHDNTNTCTQLVTILDNQLPQFTCPVGITNNADAGLCSATLVLPPLVATDNCGVLSVSSNAPPSFLVGTTPVTWTVVDNHDNTNSCVQLVTILDNQLPSFICPSGITNNADAGLCSATFALPALVATDNCGVTSVTSNAPANFPVGMTPVTWTVVDMHDNTNVCTQLVTILDVQVPQITCPSDVLTNATVACNQAVVWSDPVTSDNCTVTNVTCVPPSGSAFAVGVTPVICTVWDSSGNTNSCSFTVTVLPRADLSVEITGLANPAPLGSNLVYTITVSNAGPCTATGVVVSNFLAAGQIGFYVTNGLSGIGNACPFPGPVAWWQAEGNASDFADGNHGTVAGGVSYVVGKVGQAFAFDGLTGSVTVPDAPSLRPASVTIEGWIKIQDVTGVHVMIGKRVGSATLDSYSMWIGSGALFAAISDGTGTGPFLTYPEFPSSSGFVITDIVNLPSFAFTLQPAIPAGPLSQFIKTNLTAATLALLAAYTGGPNAQLQAALTRDLNALIETGSIYDGPRFAGVTLSAESQYILGRNPQGIDLVRLNRFLIRDGYPTEFAPEVFPQLNQQFHVAYSFDPVTQVQALYVNGGLVNASLVTNIMAYDAHPVMIGADDDNGSPGFFYQGDIDELTLYNRALTGTEIQAIYNVGAAGKCPQPISVSLGNLASGSAAQVNVVATPVSCPTVSATASVTSGTMESNLANNTATSTVPVQDLAPGDLQMSIERVNRNLNLVLIGWPLTCSPFVLEATTDLGFPIIWSPITVPLQLINDRNYTVLPASEATKYFRVKIP